MTAAASEELRIDRVVDATVIDSTADLVCTGLSLSDTLTVKVDVPLPVGVPEMTPEPVSVKPVGRLPDNIDQLYAGVPPLTARPCE